MTPNPNAWLIVYRMRMRIVIGALATVAVTLSVVMMSQPNADPGTPCKRYCVAMADDESDDGVAVFKGRGWRPGRIVVALYGTVL